MFGFSDTVIENFISYFEHRILYPATALFPVSLAVKLATFYGFLQGVFCKKKVDVCVAGLTQSLNLNEADCRVIAKAQLRMLAREKMDTCLLSKMNEKTVDKFIKIEGLSNYLDAKKTAKPVILYTSHFGRLIMPAVALGAMGYETSSLTTSPEQGCKHVTWHVKKKLRLMQSHMKGTFVTTSQSMRTLYKILARGNTLIVAVDVVPQPGQAYYEDSFLNGKVRFPKGIVKLAKKMDAVLVPYFALEHDGHLSAQILPAIETEGLDEMTIFRLLIKPIEDLIMKYPEQWWLWPMLSKFWQKEPIDA